MTLARQWAMGGHVSSGKASQCVVGRRLIGPRAPVGYDPTFRSRTPDGTNMGALRWGAVGPRPSERWRTCTAVRIRGDVDFIC